MHYLVTGHTGFKGSWLTLLLKARGHEVSGIALDPEQGGLFESAAVADDLTHDFRVDIRDADSTASAIRQIAPDVVVHMAAQPLVRLSYELPRETMDTNVTGTMNVLDAVGSMSSVRAQLIVTTDKVYRNTGRHEGYVESDSLGGDDPYSASKAMADMLTSSWVKSFPGVPTAIARGGNVIGGGDVSRDRLLPDLLRSFGEQEIAQVRNPRSVRPWQHVLDCLNGYLTICDWLLDGDRDSAIAEPWNIGPGRESFVDVGSLAQTAADLWGDGAAWATTDAQGPHEAAILAIDPTKAHAELGWRDRLVYPASVEWTVNWAQSIARGESSREVTLSQIRRFEERASVPTT